MLQFLLESGANISGKTDILRRYGLCSNKIDTHAILLQYCSEEDYQFLDKDIICMLKLGIKNARNV